VPFDRAAEPDDADALARVERLLLAVPLLFDADAVLRVVRLAPVDFLALERLV
jgi:hypothetical protein